MANLEGRFFDISEEFYDKAMVTVLDFEYTQEPGSPQVRYYSDGSGDPGEPAFNETFAELSMMCETIRLNSMKGIETTKYREWLYSQADQLRDSFKMPLERFEDIFQNSVVDLVSNFGQLPSEIDYEQSELFIDYIVANDKTLEIKLTVTIVGDIYSY